MIVELAEKYNRSAGQILLKFQVQRGIIVIPKSQNQKRQSENFDLFSFALEEADMRPVFKFRFFKVVHKLMLIRLSSRPIREAVQNTELKTDLSKILEMNDLINGRSWTEERVQHSKYFPNWN